MKCSVSYRRRIVKCSSKCLEDTIVVYRQIVDYLIHVVELEWSIFSICTNGDQACLVAERLIHKTRNRPVVKYDFDSRFYKFPSYLRRSAIHDAFGLVSSYHSNLDNWLNVDSKVRGKRPSAPKAGFSFPVLYKDNMFISGEDYTARISCGEGEERTFPVRRKGRTIPPDCGTPRLQAGAAPGRQPVPLGHFPVRGIVRKWIFSFWSGSVRTAAREGCFYR